MTQLIFDSNLSEAEIKEISKKLYLISLEMDKFVGELNTAYNQKRLETKLSIDVSSEINKRDNLFE